MFVIRLMHIAQCANELRQNKTALSAKIRIHEISECTILLEA